MSTEGDRWIPDSLANERGSVLLNLSAIGNPDETPIVFVGADLRALLRPCACGGVNGFHASDCTYHKHDDGAESCFYCEPGIDA